MAHSSSTGYGPSGNSASNWNRLCFDGDERKYEQWEIKFLGYMRLRKLKDTILCPAGETPNVAKNEEAFAELIQFLDDRSLALVMRDAVDDGRRALEILREHYAGRGKPRIVALYTELTSLKKVSSESITDYILKAEKVATALRNADEVISDGLLIAMVLKGLSAEYKPFVVVITQSDRDQTFTDFKVALRSFEDTEKAYTGDDESVVMKTVDKPALKAKNKQSGNIKCYACGQPGHKSDSCGERLANKLWCNQCRASTHSDRACRRKLKKSSVKHVNAESTPDMHSFMFSAFDESDDKSCVNSLLVDCGATSHVINDASKFVSYNKQFDPDKHFIELADGTKSNNVALEKGNVKVKLNTADGRTVAAELQDALYVPSYPQNIFSVQAATEKGAIITFGPNFAEMTTPDGTKFDIEKRGKLYYLCSSKSSMQHAASLKRWHEILGHCNTNDVLKLEGIVDGMRITDKTAFNCNICTMGKMTQSRNRGSDARATVPLQLVHSDLTGLIQPVARDGFKYAMSFVDDYSGVIFLYFLRKKSDALAATEYFLADTAPYGDVKRLRSDNGTEYTSSAFKSLLTRHRIKHEYSAPYSPHQNGTAERCWRTLFEMARCLLLNAELPKEMWTYAVRAASYIRNRCYNPRTGSTPFQLLTGKKPNLSNMHVFGTVCFAYEQNKSKLDARCKQGIFVGYDRESPAYLVYYPDVNEVRRCRCVKFTDVKTETANPADNDTEVRNTDTVTADDVSHHEVHDNQDATNSNENDKSAAENNTDKTGKRSSQRHSKPPKYLEDYYMDDSVKNNIDYCCKLSVVPRTYCEAMSSVDSPKWQRAMESEMESLNENETFEVTQLPAGRTSVGGRWVYSVKLGPDANEQFKARYVAKGYSQIEGIDYQDTFAPTARITSIRILMQIAVQYDLIVHQMDVKTAYLNAPIECEIYVDQPEGFEVRSPSNEKLVCKLKKSLYGLKQSGRNWNNLLHAFFVDNDFVRSCVDNCVYTKHVDDKIIIVLLWVDDIIVAASCESLLCDVKNLLKSRFKMTDLGLIRWFLGIHFVHSEGMIKMSQTHYLTKLLEKYQMENCKPRSTPCELKLNFNLDQVSNDCTKYREIVGSLIYAMTCTRPDLCFIVTVLSQHLANPSNEHLIALKHVLRYLKGSLNYELCFRKCDDLKLIGYSDASWGSSENRKSITGYCFSLSCNGPLISWKCKKQSTTALSSCEAEYMALAAATQECLFLTQLLKDVHQNHKCEPVTIFDDSQSAIALAKNPVNHQRSKHIDIKYHFVRDECNAGKINIVYLQTAEMIADMFTKPVSKYKLSKFKDFLFGN